MNIFFYLFSNNKEKLARNDDQVMSVVGLDTRWHAAHGAGVI